MKIYTPQDLSNEAYQEHPAISGSDLVTVYQTSLAHWRYAERKPTPALEFGIVSHAMLLEPERFASEFVRGIDPLDHPGALVTTKDMQAWLKERGQKAGGTKPELIGRIEAVSKESGEHVAILDEIVRYDRLAAEESGLTIVKPADFDKVQMMRDTIMQDETFARMLTGGFAEYSLIGKLPGCDLENKVRPDLITTGCHIIQYKTARTVNPSKFGDKCHDLGYLLKASLEWDMFIEAYGHPPKAYIILAQEKEAPFVWKPYYLTDEQISIGRQQREPTQRMIEAAIAQDRFPAYGTDLAPLELSHWITNKYEDQ